ncbi:MAG: HAMP domain-containing sensor histidine kinase [Parcubacteria group bacterium]|jgi:signal transduction histidine kinase
MSQEEAIKLDKAKSEFISIASHQLRTPLTAVKGYVSMLLEGSYGKVDPKQYEILKGVYASNERMANLVEELLDIPRIELNKMDFTFASEKLEAICQEVVDTFTSKAKDKGLYLEYKKPKTTLPELIVDGVKVRKVISDIVDNALRYTTKGGVTVKLEQMEKNIRITISDTGIGVAPEETPKLFQKISRGKGTSLFNPDGLGLNLYVDRLIIGKNGGRILVESEGKDRGAQFIVELPIETPKEILEQTADKK